MTDIRTGALMHHGLGPPTPPGVSGGSGRCRPPQDGAVRAAQPL
jgi:hypothetical protein